jgi:hypothetical protein
MQLHQTGALELVCVSSKRDLTIDPALAQNYDYVDLELLFDLDQRRQFSSIQVLLLQNVCQSLYWRRVIVDDSRFS